MICPWAAFVVMPIMDYLLPVDHSNVSEKRMRILEKDWRFMIPIYIIVIFDFGATYVVLYYISTGVICTTPLSFILYGISYCEITSVCLVVGHELIHKRKFFHKFVGTLCYSKVFYSHYFIHHIKSHHKHVGTPMDCVSARMGESVY